MMIIRDPLVLHSAPHSGAVVAIGNFDGLHLGHQAILQHTLHTARTLNAPAGILSFEPHPREFFNPSAPKLRLMNLREKILQLKAMGFSLMFLPRFNQQLASTSAEDFVAKHLVENLKLRHIVTGDNFCFGSKRSGNSQFLERAASHHGFGYSAVPAVMQNGVIVSSSAIREALAAGDVAQAGQYLGRAFAISGHVMHGDKRGRTIGFPTANIALKHLFVPLKGVYAVRVQWSSQTYNGVANIGTRPTFNGARAQLEAHLFDVNPDLYGQRITVELHHFLRDEQRFDGINAITQQLHLDAANAKKALAT